MVHIFVLHLTYIIKLKLSTFKDSILISIFIYLKGRKRDQENSHLLTHSPIADNESDQGVGGSVQISTWAGPGTPVISLTSREGRQLESQELELKRVLTRVS